MHRAEIRPEDVGIIAEPRVTFKEFYTGEFEDGCPYLGAWSNIEHLRIDTPFANALVRMEMSGISEPEIRLAAHRIERYLTGERLMGMYDEIESDREFGRIGFSARDVRFDPVPEY